MGALFDDATTADSPKFVGFVGLFCWIDMGYILRSNIAWIIIL